MPIRLASLALALLSCSEGSNPTTPDAGPLPWKPGDVRPSIRAEGPRGLLDLRGIVHAHSVYSHDACDGEPRDPVTGALNEPCVDDFRRDLCRVGHDFVMLTDHNDSFGDSEYPDVLLYRPERGDTLVERGGEPVANRAACPDGAPAALLLAGTESATLVAGLEGHVPGTVAGRKAVYGEVSAGAIEKFKVAGAVSLAMHTEDWTAEQLATLPFDGFEMYNLHANTKASAGEALDLLFKLNSPEKLPHSDLALLPLLKEDPLYLSTWATVLAGGARRATTMGTDCHRNTFQALLPDGERVDSYRRMMQWFSNHLLVRPDQGGGWDDRSLKDALRAGRLYGAFEVMGYPVGFDYHAMEGKAAREMGDEVALSKGVELRATRPRIDRLDAGLEAPVIKVRILRAKEGGWEVEAEGEGDVAFTPTQAGAYRAEVRLTPRHLRGYLSTYEALADREYPWIYSNAIYVVE